MLNERNTTQNLRSFRRARHRECRFFWHFAIVLLMAGMSLVRVLRTYERRCHEKGIGRPPDVRRRRELPSGSNPPLIGAG